MNLNIEGRGEPGTFPAAVKRVTELMPALLDDVMKGIPPEQKEKLDNLISIWDKGNVFPGKMLSDFKAKWSGAANQAAVQMNGSIAAQNASEKYVGEKFSAPVPSRPLHTPIGYPPQHLYDQGFIARKPEHPKLNGTAAMNIQPPAQQTPQQIQPPPAQGGQDINSILAALASAPKPTPHQPVAQPAASQQSAPSQMPANFAALFGQQNGVPNMQAPPQQAQMPTYSTQAAPPFQMPPNFPGFPPQPPPSVPQHYAQAPPPQQQPPPQQADPLAPLRSILPQSILGDQQKLVRALELLQDLQKDGIPMEQWGPVLQAFDSQYVPPAQPGYDDYGRGRGRSRSPDRNGGRRRASPVYGTYEDMTSHQQGQDDRRGGGRNRYRQRSPIRDSPVPVQTNNVAMNGQPMQPKYIAIDNSLPRENIKVLSRTLFVGGANGSQQEIQQLFERFGRVQTCIANKDKRHAFVKMTTRTHALSAKAGMERMQATNDREVMNIARQTKWGVGFGPRECCDYAKGESIIPIHKLTDADMKWLLTAEYGGTGGQKVEGGMVLEEPDIEIGAGVSSKAMSKRVLPDNGPPQPSAKRQQRDDSGGQRRDRNRGRNDGQGYGGGGVYVAQQQPQPMQMEAYGYARPEPVAVATPPAVPGFGGFALPGAGQYR